MKTLITAIVSLFVFCSLSVAQLSMGNIHVSGSSDLSFGSIKTRMEYDGKKIGDEVSTSNFNINPSIGYFAADNLALGISLMYESSSVEDYSTSSTLIGPYATYYFGTTNIRPFINAEIGFGSQNEDDGQDDYKMDAFAYGLSGGIAVFVNDYVSLDFGLGYANITYSDPDDSDAKLIRSGVAFNGGISVYF